MKKLVLAALLTFAVGAPAAAELADDLAAPYLHIQLALANDSIEGVAEAAASIATAAAALGDPGAAIAASAAALAAATELRTARAVFGPLSDAFHRLRRGGRLRGVAGRLLPDGRQVVGAGRGRDSEPVLRFPDAHLRRVHEVAGPASPAVCRLRPRGQRMRSAP